MARVAPKTVGPSAPVNPPGASFSGRKGAPVTVDAMGPRSVSVRPNSGGMKEPRSCVGENVVSEGGSNSFPSFRPNAGGYKAAGPGPNHGGGMKGH